MLALIAGQGGLPAYLAPQADYVAALHGFEPAVVADETFRIEHLGNFLNALKDRGVTEVCFAGAVRRPPVDPTEIDAATAPLVERITAVMGAGDDTLLRTVLDIFEEAGFRVRAAHDVAPDLLPDEGVLTQERPDAMARANAERAAKVMGIIGSADVGQACVVSGAQVIALEANLGTDWMLQSLKARTDGYGGLLYKAPKPGQDRRVDLPTIGPETVIAAAEANLHGIVIEAGGVMLLDLEKTLAEANARQRFLWVRGA
ncbi:MAG: UDP-2,3-diacylglucosamine diphosphatase LpxI [Pseudomonadota bacterium]